ncbi:hypothetical protein [Herbaspirillum huttiense]|uniref:hypothetical protein n=1 Tax=Herbaspirillum huttiense TaxID=863372 RepID=UPI0031E19F91
MPQGALPYNNAITPSGYRAPLQLDASGNLLMGAGSANKLNISAATVVKATPGRACRLIVQTAPSAGAITVNDTTTTGAAAAANQIFTIAFGSAPAGTIFNLDFPCASGIVISSVGTGGVVAISYD